MGADLGGDKHIAFQIIPLVLHIQKLGRSRNGCQRAVPVRHKANHLRPCPDSAKAAQKADGWRIASICLSPCPGNAHFNHVRASLRTFQLIYLNISICLNSPQVIFHVFSCYRTAVQHVERFDNLFNQHKVYLQIFI